MNRLKKYLTIMLLLGLTCPATACNSSSSSEDEVPPHLKPETPEEPGRDYYPKADGATRLVTYNVGVFTKYISDGSYQMIADMMTGARPIWWASANWTAARSAPAGSSSSRNSPD